MENEGRGLNEMSSRRNVLKSLALLSAIGAGPGAAAGSGPERRLETSEEITVLGGFEDGLDGWKTNGGNDLSRVEREERPFAVTSGAHGLSVSVNGDPFPMISNRERTRRANWTDYPYLLADVTPSAVSDAESTLTFRLRLHYDASETNGNREDRSGTERNGREQATMLESEETELAPLVRGQLAWSLGDVDDEKLQRAKQLDVVWYPTEHPPKTGPEGRGAGFEYEGEVTIDSVRLVKSRDSVTAAQLSQTWFDIRADHGFYTDTVLSESGEEYEAGEYVFDDGTHVPFEFEVLDENRLLLTIDGEAFEFGGGWE